MVPHSDVAFPLSFLVCGIEISDTPTHLIHIYCFLDKCVYVSLLEKKYLRECTLFRDQRGNLAREYVHLEVRTNSQNHQQIRFTNNHYLP